MSAAREYGYAVTLIEFDESESVRLRDTVRRLAELPRCTTIDSDQYGCSQLVVDHLRSRGHTQIRHLAGPKDSITADFRTRAWREARPRR